MIVNHDIHVHTQLSSCCKDPDATPEKYLARAAQLGLHTIGFANHLWDNAMPGSSKWYAPQDFHHIMQIRDQIPADTHGVRVLVGCESEFCGAGKPGISRAVADQLDFVLLPMSHFHMKGFVLPEGVESDEDVARLMVQRFKELVESGLATGIAHPFLPFGYADRIDAIIASISDAEFRECFDRAAEAGISIEIHVSFFPSCRDKVRAGFHDDSFLRVLTIAKRCGCYFHFASDAHKLVDLDNVLLLEKYVQELGIDSDDILPCLR